MPVPIPKPNREVKRLSRFDTGGTVEGVDSFTVDATALMKERHRSEQRAAEAEVRVREFSGAATALQRALIPAALPILPGAELAAAYLMAQQETAAGGDWYDAMHTPDGLVALIVGDVVGYGVAASVMMAQFRAVLAERLSGGAGLAGGLAAVDRMAARIPEARVATVCVVLLDSVAGRLRYCTAGHPPPLVLGPDGSARFLPASGAAPLGTGGPLTTAEASLELGAAVVLYSDGLLQRPGRTPEQSMGDFMAAAAPLMTGGWPEEVGTRVLAERICSRSVEILVRSTGYRDDITVLACRRVQSPQPLEVSAAATVDAVARARGALGEWLLRCEVPGPLLLLILHAVGELMTNAAVHAYRDLPDRARAADAVRLTATLGSDGQLDVKVSDRGRWRETQPDPHHVHGLDMAADLAEELHCNTGAEGTTATVRFRPTWPARMLDFRADAGLTPAARLPDERRLLILRHVDEAGVLLALDGPVDLSTTEALRQEAGWAMRQRPAAVAVDLSEASLLSSAGVALLHEFRNACVVDGIPLRLAARDGTLAAFILDLVRLPRHASPR